MHKNDNYGLYHPAFEHDSCGVGIVADILGRKSHDTVSMGLDVLDRLSHRGACGCDPETGDGGGVLIQMPHTFFQNKSDELNIELL